MPRTSPTGIGPDAVALLVVHGIGSQEPGETLRGVLGGMRLAYGASLVVRMVGEDHAVLDGLDRPVHIFEVYWADLLRGEVVEKSFQFERIYEAVWFPRLNMLSGRLPSNDEWRKRVSRWTLALVPLSSLLAAGYEGARFLAVFPTSVLRAMRESKERASGHRDKELRRVSFLEAVRQARANPDRGRTILDRLFDEIVGDVFNYVQGMARAFPEDNERTRLLTRNVAEINARFTRTAEQAIREGCREIQVLAHSLGTVIAFLAMCPEVLEKPSIEGAASITRLYTIGSPLEKIRFFWTRLVDHARNGPAIVNEGKVVAVGALEGGKSGMQWENFFSHLDLVSGPLRPFESWPVPKNIPARGLGGLISAHIAYNRNPAFLELLTEGLTGKASRIEVPFRHRIVGRMLATLETLILPAAILALAVVGLAFTVGMAWGSGWIYSQVLELFGLSTWAEGLRIFFVVAILFVQLFVGAMVGRWEAKKLYERYWAPGESKSPTL